MDTAAFGGVEKLYPVWQGLVTLSKEKNCKILYHPFISASLRPPDKSVYWKTNFLISQPKHMLWVLKEPSL